MSTKTEVDRMARTTRHLWWVGAVAATASVLSAPAGVAAAADGASSPATIASDTTANTVQAPEQAVAAASRGGFDRRDAAAVAAIVAAVLLMGFRGYVVVGAMIAGVAAVIAAGAQLLTGEPKHRAWKDWPGAVDARDATQNERSRPLGHPKAELQ
jgi:hypothetical protein